MSDASTTKVWDPLVRIFHWSLVLFFFVCLFTEDEVLWLHVWCGYGVLGLVAFRILWGLMGTPHARFSDFVRGPGTVIQYLKDIRAGHPQRYIGHNPAGGAMVLALLISLIITGISGLFVYGAEQMAGPLAGWAGALGHDAGEAAEEIHEFFSYFTLFLVGLHLIGVLLAGLQHGENLVRAMVTGTKDAR